MKKALFFFLFLLPILRGGTLVAQTGILFSSSYTLTDSSCNYRYRLTVAATGGQMPYQYKLDSLILSSTGVFNNVNGGYHTIEIKDSIGQRRLESIYLPTSVRWQASFYGGTTTCDNPNQPTYSLYVSGGQQPYRYFIGSDTVGTTVNSFPLTANAVYYVLIKDAVGCTFNAVLITPNAYENSYFYFNPVFTPNSCGDSVGTLRMRLTTNLRLTTPLSMSFGGRPFSADSVFTNIRLNDVYTVKVKTQNCGEKSSTITVWYPGSLKTIGEYFNLSNCTTQMGRLTTIVYGGSPPYRFTLDGQTEQRTDSSYVIWQNLRVGTLHTLRIRSSEGCDVTKDIVIKDRLSLPYNYNATCGQRANVTLYSQSNRNPTYQLDNQNPVRDSTSFYFIWPNIAQGNHLVRLLDSTGCVRTDTLTLYGQGGLSVQTTRSSCTDSIYRLKVSGGIPPYTYNIDGNTPTTVNDFKLVANRSYYVEVTDANYCRFANYITPISVDSVAISTFVSSSCNDSTVTLKLIVRDTNVASPLSMSFNGRPFSSDTIFQNLQGGRSYDIIVKSKQGCNLRTSVYAPLHNNGSLVVYLRDTCINRLGNTRLSPEIYGGLAPYTFAWHTGQRTWDIVATIGQYSITVTDANGCQAVATAKVSSCVWPGDTDTSGVVDNRDLLNIGLAFGETGPKRCFFDSIPNSPICIAWTAQKAVDWSKQTSVRTNYKHIDANGDGTINASDTVAIVQNWSRVHQTIEPQTPVFAAQSVAPPIFIQTSNVREGDWASFPVMLGEAGAQAENVYGLAFSIKYPPSVIEPNTMRLVVNQSWLGAPTSLLNVFKDEFDNVCHIGLVKTNKQNTTGAGQIATLVFKLKSGTKGTDLQFGVYNDYLINNSGQQLASVGRLTTVRVLTETAEPIWANQVSVYPNPTTHQVFVEAQNMDIESIKVLDIAGKMIQRIEKPSIGQPLSMPTVGTYFLKIETNKGTIVKKIVKM